MNAYLCCKIMNTVNASVPYDVYEVDVIANQGFNVVVYIYHTYQTVTLQSEIIKECRVLTERVIPVIREITW